MTKPFHLAWFLGQSFASKNWRSTWAGSASDVARWMMPDLFIANNAGYRVSWQTSLGGIPPQLFEINKKKWSGDHCSLDPEITKGIFFSNRRYDVAGVNILDIYPTICRELGVSLPGDLDGRELAPVH